MKPMIGDKGFLDKRINPAGMAAWGLGGLAIGIICAGFMIAILHPSETWSIISFLGITFLFGIGFAVKGASRPPRASSKYEAIWKWGYFRVIINFLLSPLSNKIFIPESMTVRQFLWWIFWGGVIFGILLLVVYFIP
jgi:hypothetical protein